LTDTSRHHRNCETGGGRNIINLFLRETRHRKSGCDMVLSTHVRFGSNPGRIHRFRPESGGFIVANAVQRERVAAAVRRALHEFTDRIFTDDQFHAVEDASAALEASAAAGEQRTLQERQEAFAAQMLHEIEDGNEFSPFAESPYSGELNPVSPMSAIYRREGDTIVGDVVIGPAYTGAPGRAHGGMVAAVFDDIMGGVQRITSHVGYTRELTVTYRAPFPIDEVVTFVASETSCDDRLFVVEATAIAGNILVAEATATFTRVDPTRFR